MIECLILIAQITGFAAGCCAGLTALAWLATEKAGKTMKGNESL